MTIIPPDAYARMIVVLIAFGILALGLSLSRG